LSFRQRGLLIFLAYVVIGAVSLTLLIRRMGEAKRASAEYQKSTLKAAQPFQEGK
jgi:hypothetical protein